MYAYEFDGMPYEAGDKLGYLKAIIDYGMRHDTLGAQLKKHIKEVAATL